MEFEKDKQVDKEKLITHVSDSIDDLKKCEDLTKMQKINTVSVLHRGSQYFIEELIKKEKMSPSSISEILDADINKHDIVNEECAFDAYAGIDYNSAYRERSRKKHKPGIVKLVVNGNYAGAAFRLVKSTGKGLLITTAINAALFGFCISEQYTKHPIKYFCKPKPLIADTFKSLGARFERFGDIINPPEKIAENIISVPQVPVVVTRQVFVNFDTLQEKKITELGAVEYLADSVHKFSVKDPRKGLGAAFNNFIASKEFMINIPVKARTGFNLTGMVKDKNFVVIDNELKQVKVKVPPVEILSIETRFELITEQDIMEKNGIFVKTEIMDVIKSFSNNQKKLKEGLLNKEELKQKALNDSEESLKGILSLLTGNSSRYTGYKIVFDELTESQARQMGWKPLDEIEKEQNKTENTSAQK